MSDMMTWLTARSRRKRYGRFTLHRIEYGPQTWCGNPGVEIQHRTPAEMLGDDKFEPCGRCWNSISWDNIKVEARRQEARL